MQPGTRKGKPSGSIQILAKVKLEADSELKLPRRRAAPVSAAALPEPRGLLASPGSSPRRRPSSSGGGLDRDSARTEAEDEKGKGGSLSASEAASVADRLLASASDSRANHRPSTHLTDARFEFLSSARVDGRPSRVRFPPLQHWKNERFVFERMQGSALPTIAAIELGGSSYHAHVPLSLRATPAEPSGALTSKQPGSKKRIKSETADDKVAAAPKRIKSEKADSKAAVAEPHPAKDSGSASAHPPDKCPTCGHCREGSAVNADMAPRRDEQANSVASKPTAELHIEAPSSKEPATIVSLQAPPQPPLRSVLKRRSAGGGASSSVHVKARPALTIVSGAQVTTIKSYSHLAGELWHVGFNVECDRCGGQLKWGSEGGLRGVPGRSRFAQEEAMCGNCFAEQYYSEVGAWLIVGLAASASGTMAAATAPITSLIDSLLKNRGADRQLAALLGPDVESPEIREVVLIKARSRVAAMLGSSAGGTAALEDVHASDDDGSSAAPSGHATASGSSSRPLLSSSTSSAGRSEHVKQPRGR